MSDSRRRLVRRAAPKITTPAAWKVVFAEAATHKFFFIRPDCTVLSDFSTAAPESAGLEYMVVRLLLLTMDGLRRWQDGGRVMDCKSAATICKSAAYKRNDTILPPSSSPSQLSPTSPPSPPPSRYHHRRHINQYLAHHPYHPHQHHLRHQYPHCHRHPH